MIIFLVAFLGLAFYAYADDEPIDTDPVGSGCVCGACCSCRCTCDQWNGVWCLQYVRLSDGSIQHSNTYTPSAFGICYHACTDPTCDHTSHPENFGHCECHHSINNGSGSDLTFPNLEVPEVPNSDSWGGRFNFSKPVLPDIPNLGGLPPVYIPPDLPPFDLPPVLLPSPYALSVPSNPEYFELDYFSYEGGFPVLKFSDMFNDFKSEFEKKIDLSVYSGLVGGTAERLVWVIDYSFLGSRLGPYTINITDILTSASSFSIVNITRTILVFILYTIFVFFVLRMLFFA